MGKYILLLLLMCAALFGCGTPLIKATVENKIPYISVGNKYIFYNYIDPYVTRCDTIEVIGEENYCVHFKHKNQEYIMDKRVFKHRTSPLGEETKKPHKK